jgi:poly(A) polymerase
VIPDKLPHAEWLDRADVQTIFAVLDGASGKTRAVGGIVRDTLMGRLRADSDIDMATEFLPVAVMQRAKAAGISTYPTGIDHGTVTLRLNETSVEVTTLRRDVQTDGRHAEVAFGTDWGEDARRRDFTLNALYCGPDGRLFDPLSGAGDALNGRVRFIGDAAQRIAEDGLRVYRFFRFTASHGGEKLDADGLAACQAAVGRLDHLSAERVGSEMIRILGLPKVAMTLGIMAEIGLLDVARERLASIVRYELLGGADAATRLSIIAGEGLENWQESWRLSNALVDRAGRISAAASLISEDEIALAVYKYRDDAVEGLARAAAQGHWPRDRLMEAARELARLPKPDMPVSGKDLIASGVEPGPEIGDLLARLEHVWVESGFTLSREDLLAQIA